MFFLSVIASLVTFCGYDLYVIEFCYDGENLHCTVSMPFMVFS